MSEIKELTEIEKAAGHYVYHSGSKNMLLRINAFEAGAKWQKERDYKIALQLVGLHDFIADPIQRAKFIEIVNKLL